MPARLDSRWSRTAAVVCLAGLLACGGSPEGETVSEPPRPDDTAQLDPMLAAVIEKGLEQLEANPEGAQEWAGLGMIYHANEFFALGRQCYEKALELKPESPRWWYHLARVRHRLGDLPAAFEAMERSIALDDRYAPSLWRRGNWSVDQADVDQAEADFRRAVELAPGDPSARLGLARALLEKEAAGEAASLLEPVVAAEPDDAYAHLLLGNAYRALGRDDEAAEQLRLGQGDQLVRNDPWTAEMLMARASFGSQVQVAVQLLNAGQTERATTMLERLREMVPDDARVLTQLGHAYTVQKRHDEAMATLQDALTQHPDNYKVHLELATAFQTQDEPEQALSHVNRALELKPEAALAHARRAAIFQAAGDLPKAATAYQKALNYKPGDAMLLRALGDVLGQMSRYELAAAAYQQALIATPDDAEIHARLGFMLYRLGRLAGAEKLLARSLELGASRAEEVGRLLREVQRLRQTGSPGQE